MTTPFVTPCCCFDGYWLRQIPLLMSVRCRDHRDQPPLDGHVLALETDDDELGIVHFASEDDRLLAKRLFYERWLASTGALG